MLDLFQKLRDSINVLTANEVALLVVFASALLALLAFLFKTSIVGFFKACKWAVVSLFRSELPSVSGNYSIQPPTDTFTGRKSNMRAIKKALTARKAVSIASVQGMGGIGKTETARKVVYDLRAKGCFKDGGLEINLRGYDKSAAPMSGEEALQNLLGGMSLPTDGDFQALQSRWRAATADKDMILLFDNASREDLIEQIRPAYGPTVLVTSREDILGRAIRLDGLNRKESRKLVKRLAPRVKSKHAIDKIADFGFYIPLVIEVIAKDVERLITMPVMEVLQEFESIHVRCNAKSGKRDETITEIFGHSISALTKEEQSQYVALSLFVGSIPEILSAALWGMKLHEAKAKLHDWASRNLIEVDEPIHSHAGWRQHDLLSGAASQFLKNLPEGEQRALKRRWASVMCKWLRALEGEYKADDVKALALLDRDKATIEAAQAWAVENWEEDMTSGFSELANSTLWFPNNNLLTLRLHNNTRFEWLEASLAAAERVGSPSDKAMVLGNLGWVARHIGRFDLAKDILEKQIVMHRELNEKLGQAIGELNLGSLFVSLPVSNLDDAELAYIRCIELCKELLKSVGTEKTRDAKVTMSQALGNLGSVFFQQGRIRNGILQIQKSILLSREIGARDVIAPHSLNLAVILRELGDISSAIPAAEEAKQLAITLGLPDILDKAEKLLAEIENHH